MRTQNGLLIWEDAKSVEPTKGMDVDEAADVAGDGSGGFDISEDEGHPRCTPNKKQKVVTIPCGHR